MTEEPEQTAEDVAATPAAADLAAEHGVDLTAVEGSGVEGRVTKPDVEEHVAAAAEAGDSPDAASSAHSRIDELHARVDALVAKLGGILGTSVED